MSLWIRSQDKEILINVIAVGVDIGSNIYAITNNDKLEPLVIGNYSTKEKALKVLDMIETHLEDLEYKIHNRNFIFQMPDDEDIEEEWQYNGL